MRLTYRARAARILLFYNGFRLLLTLCQLLRLRLLILGDSRFEREDALAQDHIYWASSNRKSTMLTLRMPSKSLI